MALEARTYKDTTIPHWYAARTRFGQEVGVKERLQKLDVECYIPTEKKKNYRGHMKDHPVIPCMVFIKATRAKACALKTEEYLPVNYIFDYVSHTMLTVPDKQMEDFRRVLESSLEEGGLMDQPLALGDRVRVTKGALKDVEGNVLELMGKIYVVVGICGLVYAKAKIPRAWLEKV